MRDFDAVKEERFFSLFQKYFDAEKDAARQHDPANYSLSRMYPLAEVAGNPQRKLKVIHIAGTKGKGTTSHFISALLAACGKHVGLFTSPHLSTVRERFQVDNKLLPYETLEQSASELLARVDALGQHPSLFEIFTVLALKIFVDCGVEYAVMETGIGGRLDATNYIPNPIVTVITPVSFDHVALLGHTIEAIAGEKAGIIKRGVPLVISRQPFAAGEQVLKACAAQLAAPIVPTAPIQDAKAFLPQQFPDFLLENFTSSLAAVRTLGLDPKPENFTLPQLRARFEKIHDRPTVLIDGAHNGDSMQKLVASLRMIYPATNWTVILGCVAGKDVRGMVEALKNLPNASFVLTNPHTGKGSALAELRDCAKSLNVIDEIQNLQEISQLPPAEAYLFTGSFFTASIAEKLFN